MKKILGIPGLKEPLIEMRGQNPENTHSTNIF
jgi:hypothetical protein